MRTPRVMCATVFAAVMGCALPEIEAANWPQWRGINRDAVSQEKGLLQTWPAEGPPLAWKMTGLGEGKASVAVVGRKVYTMGDRSGSQFILAFDLDERKELWAARVGTRWDGGAYCTPTVAGELIFGIGTYGDLVCVETATGKEVWRRNFGKDFDGKGMTGWGWSESPLVDGDNVVCTPGADQAMMVALNKKTGATVWKAPKPPDHSAGAGYSSIIICNAAGVKQYVQNTGGGLIGVSAADGKLLWANKKIARGTAHACTPVAGGDYVFCSNGYGGGAVFLKIVAGGGGLKAEEIAYVPADKFANWHGGAVLVGDYLFGGHGWDTDSRPTCLNLKTGQVMWQVSPAAGDSLSVAYADGRVYMRYGDGTMMLVEPSPEGFKVAGKFKEAVTGGRSLAHPVISDGKLYLRCQNTLMCYDITKK